MVFGSFALAMSAAFHLAYFDFSSTCNNNKKTPKKEERQREREGKQQQQYTSEKLTITAGTGELLFTQYKRIPFAVATPSSRRNPILNSGR